ncbi:uncharacterized protein N7459_005007 [Penicillium hispanicum]|uniref:uncharacterized protein n=1 Tax=Penicillium hispanicum TaxID=1080232 RepID=UPI00253FA192|nr:uncharacterized protein N7459_005007 [Penicillium hispanicum]KAJ5585207.1 hypothetical protein N7459_005007 [Penicillium hispanicum]
MKKAFTFLPGHRPAKEPKSGDTRSTFSKRREQLRNAQRTYRQRKDDYFKSLEKEVIRLRASEADLLGQLKKARDHVERLEGILGKHQLYELANSDGEANGPSIGTDMGVMKPVEPYDHDHRDDALNFGDLELGTDSQGFTPPVHLLGQLTDSDTTSDYAPNLHGNVESTKSHSQPPLLYPQPHSPLSHPNLTDMGMEFVLSLESPCLPHLESHQDKPNGHALLLTTAFSCPQHQHTVSSLQDPVVIFDRLLALSKDLVQEDELSPTQAWSYLLAQPMIYSLDIGKLRKLSASLLKIIECHGFGAVMRRDAFESILCQLPQLPLGDTASR